MPQVKCFKDTNALAYCTLVYEQAKAKITLQEELF